LSDTAIADPVPGLLVTNPADVPEEPPEELRYRHSSNLLPSLRELWARREMIFTLAERDVRASYKQATLGIAWALITPIAYLVIFTLVFTRFTHSVKSLDIGNIPYAVYAYPGILCWTYFSTSLSSGGNSMLSNVALLQKTYFPRACFPLSQMVEAALYSVIAFIPLGIVFGIYGFAPKVETLWIPLFVVIELAFTMGVVLAFSALVVHVRDLVQVMGLLLQMGMLATPVIWPFSKVHGSLQILYGLFNPLGPVIDNVRRTMLYGLQPHWSVVLAGAIGAAGYLVFGYVVFKRLEVTFADIA
jgi:lipopolysaccharide transport system permease protein